MIRKIGDRYTVDFRSNGKRIRQAGFKTRRKAEDFVDAIKAKGRERRAGILQTSNIAIRELFNKRLEKITNRAERVRAVRIFNTFISVNGNLDLRDVRSSHFRQYNASRDVKPETINREMNVLSTAFRSAQELFPNLDFEPPRVVRPRFKKSAGRQRVITESELAAILVHIRTDRLKREHDVRTDARPAVADAFELAWLLGLRFGEVKGLKQSDLNIDARTLRVVRWKTSTVSILKYLPDRVIELLSRDTDPLFSFRCSHHTVADIIEKAVKNAGLSYGREAIDGITFHSTRHSFTTRLIRVTDLATAQSFTGHATKEMLGYYGHATDDSQRDAMERMYGSPLELKEIYEKVRAGKLSFNDFQNALLAQKRTE